MLEKLIKEMFEPCYTCDGSGEKGIWDNKDRNSFVDTETCSNCNGKRRVLSNEGAILRHIILHGEHPYD